MALLRVLPAVGLLMLLSGLGAFYATGERSAFALANLILGPLVLLAAGVVQARQVQGFSGSLSRRIVLRWSAILAAVLVAVVALNVLGQSWNARIDLTVEGSYTLSEQTVRACEEMALREPPPDIDLYFFEDSLLARDVRLLVRAYDAKCPHLAVHEMRHEEAPHEAARVFSSFSTSVVACRDGSCDPVGYPSEENITNSLLRLGRDETVIAYFLIGHGEVNLASGEEDGYSMLTDALRNEGITPRAVVGPSREAVPGDADLVIAMSPQRNLLDEEIAALDLYLSQGGRLLALVEPGVETNLHELLARWGIEVGDGVIADPAASPLLRDPKQIALIAHLFAPYHPVTRKLTSRTMVLAPGARPVVAARKPQIDDDLQNLVYSTQRSWVERDVTGALGGRTVSRDPEEETGVEIPIGAAGRYPRGDAEARIVVFGDRDFASNRLLTALYGRDLFLNAVWWLAEREDRVAIRPKAWTPDQDPLTLQQTVAYFYFMAFALPEILLLLGIHAWYRQRT